MFVRIRPIKDIKRGNDFKVNIIEKIRDERLPIVIFGAGIVGEVLYHACCRAGMKVECFCDNNINKTKKLLCNIEVVHTPSLRTKYKDAIFLISASDMKDVVDQLRNLEYSRWYSCNLLLQDFDIYRYEFSAPMEFVDYAVATAILCHDNYLSPDKLFLRSIDIIITERCSLKCRDCSNLMRYYKHPKDCDTKELMKDIDKFCTLVDEINEFRVLGGEPFMNKEAHIIIKRLIDEPKAKKAVIYTNGTIVPREEQIEYFRNNKVLFIITDYGELSRNLNTLTQKLSVNNIAFYVQKARGWTDCAKIRRHYRNIEQQREIFGNCCAKNTITLSKGKLYRCPFSANAARLHAVPDFNNDYVNIFDDAIDINEMKEKIRRFLFKKDFLEVCDYCNGRSFGDPEIKPAVQIDKSIEYEQCR